jgi:hypothetical protein
VQYLVRASLLSALVAAGACSFDKQGIDIGDGEVDASQPIDADPGDPDAPRPDAALADAAIDATTPPADAAVDAAEDPVDAGLPDAALPCPTGYTHGGEDGPNATHCYKFVGLLRNWQTAENDCANDAFGAHLIVVDNEDEFDGILDELSGTHWVGTTDRGNEGTFTNITGTPFTFGHYQSAEPNDGNDGPAGNAEDCLALVDQGNQSGFNDESCANVHTYVCEVDGTPPLP